MDQEFRRVDKFNRRNKNNFLLRTLQLTLSVSIFSFVLCYTSGFSFFPHSFNIYFSTFLFSFLAHTLERKYMFLICKGILVFLVKTSVSCTTTTSSPSAAYVGGDEFSAAHQLSLKNVALVAEGSTEEEEEEEVKGSVFGEEERGADDEGFIAEAEDDNKEGENTVVVQEEDNNADQVEATEEASGDIRSVDELNKRIEEFIRKMKEEIRIEAQQQQPITV